MNTSIILQIQTFHGYAHETAGIVNGFFDVPEEARACGHELSTRCGADVEICGCQLTVWNR